MGKDKAEDTVSPPWTWEGEGGAVPETSQVMTYDRVGSAFPPA